MVLDITIIMAATTTVAGVVHISIHRIITINLILGAKAPMASTGTITMVRNPVSTHGVLRRSPGILKLLEALILMVVTMVVVVMTMVV